MQVDDEEVDFALHDVMQPDLYDEIDDCDFLLIYLELHNLMLDDDEGDDEMLADYECADDEIDEQHDIDEVVVYENQPQLVEVEVEGDLLDVSDETEHDEYLLHAIQQLVDTM